MAFQLTSYQEDASQECVAELLDAQRAYESRSKQTAVGLSAPTGAGKTVIATSVLETLILGSDTVDPNPNLAVLWVTDDPSLNRQTLNRMLTASARFTDGDFVEIDSGFDQPVLERGKIHFAHIHLFFKNTTSMQPSNTRENGLWQIVAESVKRYGTDFLLVVDEAHKGTGSPAKESTTTVGRLSHGSNGKAHFTGHDHPAAPVIFGISATIDKFEKSMKRHDRSLESVSVPVSEVRESGLLKDRIVVRHPGEKQPSEDTLLVQAVESLKKSDEAWAEHARLTGRGPVVPLLVLQVPPGVKDGDINQYLATVEKTWPILKGDAVAHAFESHATLKLGTPGSEREVRYVAPDRIADDQHVRVVLFKSALTTGWDCPRAEVMLSLRVAQDFTNIAQLIGRMVRTPLAERIEDEEVDTDLLNAVTLFLPHYNRAGVAQVINALNDETQGDIEVDIEPIDCVKRADVPDQCWKLLADLPSSRQLRKNWTSETHRLLGLAALLREHGFVKDAVAQVQKRLVGAVVTEVDVHAEEIDDLVEDVMSLTVAQTVFDQRHGGMIVEDGEPPTVAATAVDIDRQYKAAVRKLPDATGKWYFAHLCDDDEVDTSESKAQVAALVKTKEMQETFVEAVESAANDQIDKWRSKFANRVDRLPKDAQVRFEAAWHPKSGTVSTYVEIPDTVSAKSERIVGSGDDAKLAKVDVWPNHLYVAPEGQKAVKPGLFPATLTGWERDVLEKELAFDELQGWYRNPSSGKHGLAVPYKSGDGWRLMYPDFVFFAESDGKIRVDIVDPHRHNEADTGAKWAALARWAQDKDAPKALRRVVGVIKVGDDLRSLSLTNPDVIALLDEAGSKDDIEALFTSHGGDY